MKKTILIIITAFLISSCSGYFGGFNEPSDGTGLKTLALVGGGTLSDDVAQDQYPFLYRYNGQAYLIFSSDRGSPGKMKLWYSQMDAAGKFTSPQAVPITDNSTNYSQLSPAVFNYNGTNYLVFLFNDSMPYGNIDTWILDSQLTPVSNVSVLPALPPYTALGLIQDATSPRLLLANGSPVVSVFEFTGSSWLSTNTISGDLPVNAMSGFNTNGVDHYIASTPKAMYGVQQLLYGNSTMGTLLPVLFYASAFNDFAPFVDPLTYKVYFSSDRFGKGNYDLYRYNLVTYDLLMAAPAPNTNIPTVQVVFVSLTGSDANIGTNNLFPVKTLNVAVSNAVALGISNIFVTGSTFQPGNGLPASGSGLSISNCSNMFIAGGWDSSFLFQAQPTVLDGAGTLYHVVSMVNSSNIIFENFTFTRGNAVGLNPDNRGAGVYMSNDVECAFIAVSVMTNGASSYGGGIYMMNCSQNVITATIISNRGNNGGGVYAVNSKNNGIVGEVSYNYASTGNGGGICLESSSVNFITSIVHHNSSALDGGGIYMNGGGQNMVLSTGVSNNTATGTGGGIEIYAETNDTVQSVRVYGNTAGASGFGGGGIMIDIYCTLVNVILCTVDGNISQNYGGGIEVYGNTFTSIMNTYITNNFYANAASGEVHLRASVPGITGLNMNACVILGTNASPSCTGIYEDAAVSGQTLTFNQFDAPGYPLSVYYRDSGQGNLTTLVDVNNPVKTGSTLDSTNNY